MPETYAIEVPEDIDPAEVVSLVLPYMTAYQLLHRMARVKSGETVLVHGAAGRGTAVLEVGALAGLRLYGTADTRSPTAQEDKPLAPLQNVHVHDSGVKRLHH